jgi:hypothetical protein
MILKRRVMDPRQKDEMSEALAYDQPTDDGGTYWFVPQYIYNYYPNGLRERCVGPHSRNLIGVTRYYPRAQPPVVIDFEPPPPEPWYREEKLQFFLEQGIAYVPILLRDQLSTEAFMERVDAAKRMALAGKAESQELAVLASVGKDVETWLQDPALVSSIDAEVLEAAGDHQDAADPEAAGGYETWPSCGPLPAPSTACGGGSVTGRTTSTSTRWRWTRSPMVSKIPSRCRKAASSRTP